MKIYLAGPMSGLPEHNYPAFFAAARAWRAAGQEIVNPAELDGAGNDGTWEWYMRRDLPWLCGCDAVAALPGWEGSRGARLEVHVARALGMPVACALNSRLLFSGVREGCLNI